MNINNNKMPFIIAEAGVNHNASLKLALELVEAAKYAGADAVKFQVAIPDLVSTEKAPKAKYQITDKKESQLDLIRRIHLPLEKYFIIKKFCRAKRIMFLASGFDLTSLQFIENLGVSMHKIPSGEITNLLFLNLVKSFNKDIVLSTGMSNLNEIKAALKILKAKNEKNQKISLLQCTSCYPAKSKSINLLAMKKMKNEFNLDVGLSDHSLGIEIPIAAATLGASIIEKHITLCKKLKGPDHQASLTPEEFKEMVQKIKNVKNSLGDETKKCLIEEQANKKVVRKSLVASSFISKGEKFTLLNITAKRPGSGLSPMNLYKILGRRSKFNLKPNDLIKV